jgi:hypothetical protein
VLRIGITSEASVTSVETEPLGGKRNFLKVFAVFRQYPDSIVESGFGIRIRGK